ncbi:hypothetical protein [Flavobacterium sp.]|jgi:hypothetical protein|uniref:hypothetical protein n=1 Tax=Flavobacterium sp. TaxID=239 RepID=UPI00391BAA94
MASLKELNENTMVVTSTYIVNDGMPILYVSNEDDEEEGVIWQFHCGNGDYNMERMLLVKLETILNLDSELINLDLKIGQEAFRENKKAFWKIK